MLSFALYLIGAVVVIAGLACIATLLGAASTIVTGASGLLLLAALISAGALRRENEPSP